MEPTDANPLSAALRETREELGIAPDAIRVLGALSPVITQSTGFLIHPFVGLVKPDCRLTPDPREVAESLELPLEPFLTAPPGTERFAFGETVVHGATARIMTQLTARLLTALTESPPCAS